MPVLRRRLRHLQQFYLGDCGRRTKWRQFTLMTLILLFFGLYQLTNNYPLVAHQESPLEGRDFSRSNSNKRAIKSVYMDISRFSKTTSLSEKVLSQRGPQTSDVNCKALFRGDEREISKAHHWMSRNRRHTLSDSDYMYLTQNCTRFRRSRGYIEKPMSKDEADFPIAFSILTYKDIEQLERLLRAIYMPQNYYCIHIDTKASESFRLSVQGLTKCFPNIFLSSRLESVYWGHISIVSAEMTCLADLMKYKDWKYYINLSGQMFPLQSNGDLVKILKLYNGANDIEGTYLRNQHNWMFWRQVVSWQLFDWCGCLMLTPYLKDSPPHNITVFKGSNQVAITREFVKFTLYSKPARDLFDWLKDTLAPDEYFFPTLNHNAHLGAPGGYIGNPERKVFTARASMWSKSSDQVNWSWDDRPCRGTWVRGICILGVGDLQWTYNRPELFVNKVFMDFEPLTLDCLEEMIFNRTIYKETSKRIPEYYNNMDIVKHRELVITNYS